MAFGVTDQGFLQKSLEDILSEIEQAQRDTISQTLNTTATSPIGQLNGIFADKLRELWDVAAAIYRSPYPDSASGEALDQVCSITGVARLPATRSLITLDQLYLNAGVTVPAGSVVSIGASGARWVLLEDVTNAAGWPETCSGPARAEEYGPVQGYSGTIDTIQSPIVGWSAAAALTCANAEPYDLADGDTLTLQIDRGLTQTVTFHTGDFVDIDAATASEVAAVIDAALTGGTSYAAGPRVRIASDTDGTGSAVKVTGGTSNTALGFDTDIVAGFNSVDATPGRNIETDAELRIRRENLLRITGKATVEAIRSAILDVDSVVQAYVFENDTDVTDGYGIPPHSIEAVVSGGTDADVAAAIYDSKAAGIRAHGDTTIVVTDSMGFTHDIGFSRPTPVPIWIDLTIVVNSGTFPVDGEAQIKAALATFGDGIGIGEDVIALQFHCVPLSVAGVVDVTAFKIDIVNPPVNTANIVISVAEIATFDTSRITITVTP